MGHAADAKTIRERFNTKWPDEQASIAFTFAGVDYNPAEDSPWVRLAVIPGEQVQVSMGQKRRFRRTGIAAVNIFIPVGEGDGLARELADSVANIFQGVTVSGVIFRGTGLDFVGEDGAWSVWIANTPYQADDLVE